MEKSSDWVGRELVHFSRITSLLHLGARVEILPAAGRLPELPLLVLLGWYLTILRQREAAAAAAA